MTVAKLAAGIDSAEGLLVYREGDEWTCAHIGIDYTDLAELLYRLADEIVDQHIPPPDWRQRIR